MSLNQTTLTLLLQLAEACLVPALALGWGLAAYRVNYSAYAKKDQKLIANWKTAAYAGCKGRYAEACFLVVLVLLTTAGGFYTTFATAMIQPRLTSVERSSIQVFNTLTSNDYVARDLSSRAWESTSSMISREELRLADEPKTRIEELAVSVEDGALAISWGDVTVQADKTRYGVCGEGQKDIEAATWVTATTSSCMDMAENMTAEDQICVKPLHPGIREASNICFGSIGRPIDRKTPERERRTSTRAVVTLGATQDLLLEIRIERVLTLGDEAAPLELAELSSRPPVEDLNVTSGLSSFTWLELGATSYGRLSQNFVTVTYNMSTKTATQIFNESVSMLQVGSIPSQMNEAHHKYWESTSLGDAGRAAVGSVQQTSEPDEDRLDNMRRLRQMGMHGTLATWRLEKTVYLAAVVGYIAVPVVMLLAFWVLSRYVDTFGTNTITENMYACNHPGLNGYEPKDKSFLERMFVPEHWAREPVTRLKTDTHVTVALGDGILQYRPIEQEMIEVRNSEDMYMKQRAGGNLVLDQ